MGELAGEAGDDDDNGAGEETAGDAGPETWPDSANDSASDSSSESGGNSASASAPDSALDSVLDSADKSALETRGGSLEFKLFLQNQKISHNNLKAKTWKINPVFIRRNVLNNFAPAKNFVAAITTLPLGHV